MHRKKPLKISNNYEIGELLGEGTYGKVYKALRQSDGKTIALKITDVSGVEQWLIDGTMNEIRALEMLSGPNCHPNVVCYYNSFHDEADKKIYIEMEYIKGKTMYDFVIDNWEKGLQRTPDYYNKLIKITRDVSKGLKYTHSKGIFHNDIKLGNIMIINPDDPENIAAIIIDYGLICNIERDHVMWDEYCESNSGTYDYIPPEHVIYGVRLPGSDLWALGVSVYVAIMGRKIFKEKSGEGWDEIAKKIRYGKIPKADTSNKVLNTLVNGILTKDYWKRLDVNDVLSIIDKYQPKRRLERSTKFAVPKSRPTISKMRSSAILLLL